MNKRRPLIILAAAAAILAVSGVFAPGSGLLISEAHAVVGRPLTPVSYAGVARRTTRRAVAATAATATPGVVVVPTATTIVYTPTPGCVQIVDAYGRIAYKCN